MPKYQLVTNSTWAGTDQYHVIDGDFENEDAALEAFGGVGDAEIQAQEDHGVEWHIELVEED